MRISIIGTGYVGAVSGAGFAELGHQVTCVDIDEKKIAQFNQGIIPFVEPGLPEMVQENMKVGRLNFTTDYGVTREAKACFIAVDTPSGPDGSANLNNLFRVVETLVSHISANTVIVIKSTVPPGTSEKVQDLFQLKYKGLGKNWDGSVASNPEFLREGSAIQDFLHPDRVIIGTNDELGREVLTSIYEPLKLSPRQIQCYDRTSAEAAKYVANTMLAVRISFMNEVANLCKAIGADVEAVGQAIGSDHRIGHHFLKAGVGFGGSCFPKDVRAFETIGRLNGVSMPVIEGILKTNEAQKELLGQMIEEYFEERGGVAGKTIAILGLAFKRDTDDMREAPSLVVIRRLLEIGANLHLCDPVAVDTARKALGSDSDQIKWFSNFSDPDFAHKADALALVTEWKEFSDLDHIKSISERMKKQRVFFDGWRAFQQDEINQLGMNYEAIGRRTIKATIIQTANR